MSKTSMTPDERRVVDTLAEAFNMFNKLPTQHDMDAEQQEGDR
jgi:hypothetical protein